MDSRKRNSKDEDESSSESEQELVTSFQSYVAEGDILAKMGNLGHAIDAYTKALKMRSGDKNALVARAKCYLLLGDPQSALQDSDQALSSDANFFKGIYQKAESLYAKGDFEMALVYFHRGQSLRPEFDDFRLGIQNCREAIDNSIGNPKYCKFKPLPGAKIVVTLPPSKPGIALTGTAAPVPITEWVVPKTEQPNVKGLLSTPKETNQVQNERKVKQLLGELYADKEYLTRLLNDKDFVEHPNQKISVIAQEALSYLDKRTEFWRQQKPRKKEQKTRVVIHPIPQTSHPPPPSKKEKQVDKKKIIQKKINSTLPPKMNNKQPIIPQTASPKIKPSTNSIEFFKSSRQQSASQQSKIVSSTFETIHKSMHKGDYEVALRAAKNLLARLTELRDLPSKEKVSADIYHDMGNIYLQLNNPSEALMYFRKEHILSREHRLFDTASRSLSEIGRIQIKSRKYKEAISAFQEKLKYVKEFSLEKVWLLHDLGRCFLELKNLEKALDFGQKSAALAVHLQDSRWTMNAQLLIAQTFGRKKDYKLGIEAYQVAFNSATVLQDDMAIKAIKRAISEVQDVLK